MVQQHAYLAHLFRTEGWRRGNSVGTVANVHSDRNQSIQEAPNRRVAVSHLFDNSDTPTLGKADMSTPLKDTAQLFKLRTSQALVGTSAYTR
jgi:hypothetical protein